MGSMRCAMLPSSYSACGSTVAREGWVTHLDPVLSRHSHQSGEKLPLRWRATHRRNLRVAQLPSKRGAMGQQKN